jgi:hypothetical protein
LLCAILVLRSWRRSGQRLLLLVGLCFAGLAVNNLLLVVDLVVLPSRIDLSLLRGAVGFGATASFLFALIWEAG